MAKKTRKAEVLTPEQDLCFMAFEVASKTGWLGKRLIDVLDDKAVDPDLRERAVELSAAFYDLSSELWDLSWEMKKIVTGEGSSYERSR